MRRHVELSSLTKLDWPNSPNVENNTVNYIQECVNNGPIFLDRYITPVAAKVVLCRGRGPKSGTGKELFWNENKL